MQFHKSMLPSSKYKQIESLFIVLSKFYTQLHSSVVQVHLHHQCCRPIQFLDTNQRLSSLLYRKHNDKKSVLQNIKTLTQS